MFFEKFEEQHEGFREILMNSKYLSFATLGPKGTSSYNTLIAFINEIKCVNKECTFEVVLRDDFSEVNNLLEEKQVDFALIPAAYEKVTDFFWNMGFENIYNFLYETPKYGMVARKNEIFKERNEINIATCPAVEKLVSSLKQDIISYKELNLMRTFSTTEAAKVVANGSADIAITNESSVCIFKDKIEFISNMVSSNMLWCIFHNREKEYS